MIVLKFLLGMFSIIAAAALLFGLSAAAKWAWVAARMGIERANTCVWHNPVYASREGVPVLAKMITVLIIAAMFAVVGYCIGHIWFILL